MAAPFATVFFAGGGGDLSGGFLSGAALDDESGRPLAGADVKLYASGAVLPGAAPAALVTPPTASTVTDGRGRFSLTGDIAAGRYALVLSRTGYTRAVRRLALEPSVGAVPFGSRLTPLARAGRVPARAGLRRLVRGARGLERDGRLRAERARVRDEPRRPPDAALRARACPSRSRSAGRRSPRPSCA